MAYRFKLVPLEVSFEDGVAVLMLELSGAIHQTVFEVASILVAEHPIECAFTFDHVFFEFSLVCASISEDCKSLS